MVRRQRMGVAIHYPLTRSHGGDSLGPGIDEQLHHIRVRQIDDPTDRHAYARVEHVTAESDHQTGDDAEPEQQLEHVIEWTRRESTEEEEDTREEEIPTRRGKITFDTTNARLSRHTIDSAEMRRRVSECASVCTSRAMRSSSCLLTCAGCMPRSPASARTCGMSIAHAAAYMTPTSRRKMPYSIEVVVIVVIIAS
jgi:hypothetical protein